MQEEKKDYGKTLNLPKTDFPMRASLPEREPEILEKVFNNDLYEKMLKKNEGKTSFVLHDGPPYANGEIHIGHALNKILKENDNANIYNKCVKYISVRLRSKKEIIDYLKKLNIDNTADIIDKLTKNNLINDEVFTKAFIKDKINFTSYGPYRIRQELNKYNIDNEIKERFFAVFNDKQYPLIQIINEDNFDEILKYSKEMRNTIRGQDIGELG